LINILIKQKNLTRNDSDIKSAGSDLGWEKIDDIWKSKPINKKTYFISPSFSTTVLQEDDNENHFDKEDTYNLIGNKV
jgi:hypothetical protein